MAGVSAEGKRQGRVSSEKAKHQNPGSPPHGQTAQTLSHGHTLKGKGRVVRGSTGIGQLEHREMEQVRMPMGRWAAPSGVREAADWVLWAKSHASPGQLLHGKPKM